MSGSRRTVDDMRVMFQSCEGFDPQQTTDFFNSWAETYEQDSETMKYRAPQLAVDFLNDHFCGSRGDAQVLDVACGSGLAAKLMFDLGFKHFVGVDGSKGMLEQAAKSGLYRELKLALLGTDPLPAQTGGFDVVIITGALRDDYVPVSVIRELCKATKPGGRVVQKGSTHGVCGNTTAGSTSTDVGGKHAHGVQGSNGELLCLQLFTVNKEHCLHRRVCVLGPPFPTSPRSASQTVTVTG
ncbi:methyltransferase-like protein 27 isoform X1 [Maylandia zebra]|uniref:methyltransferase-like protein 27 isoform X1 n=1 Tax=Maylandia zebra TaxID=106582 RepID=UPI00403CA48E